MIETEHHSKVRVTRTIVVIGVIACLCFSVGEGLQLTPFPISALKDSRTSTTEPNVGFSFANSSRKYGPLDVPTRVQKRGKRQGVHHAHAPSPNSRGLASRPVPPFVAGALVVVVSLHVELSSPGRAPPSS